MTLSDLNRRTFLRLFGSAFAAFRILPAKADPPAPAQSSSNSATTGSPRVVVYPAPQGEVLSSDYAIEVNGRPVPVYVIKSRWHDKKYSAAYFDFSGSVTVTIRPNLSELGVTASLDRLKVRPERYGIQPSIENGVLSFTTDKHFNISVEPNGTHSPLHLFSNPIEENPPKSGDPGVIYFGPGVHTPTHIHLTAGQTLYIAGGAVVNAAVTSTGDNIRIMGRGILSGDLWQHSYIPQYVEAENGVKLLPERMVWPSDGRNILIEDIIIRGSWTWTVVPSRCDQVLIRNLRICGSRCANDDGIDACNCSNVTIRDCFIHTDDDGICMKGTAIDDQDPRPTENVVVEDCTFWIDFANGFRLGTESRARACRNFTASNIDIIHFPSNPQAGPPGSGGPQAAVFQFSPQGEMPMENLAFNNIRINGELPLQLIGLTCSWTTKPAASEHPVGPYVHNVAFRDVNVYGRHEGPELSPLIFMEGLDAEHDIENVILTNVVLHGKAVTRDTAGVQIGEFVSGVVFD